MMMMEDEGKMATTTTSSTSASTVPGARLMITKMVLTNFKSYAGEKIIGPFHKRFTSIVGPNGSGKSNVIDALQFVFGKRASKLRLKKVSQLIHSSTEHPNCKQCKVTVYFQDIVDNDKGDNGYAVVPGSEFVVQRTAFKNNSSKYTLDGKGITFTEVTAFLRRRGIDLDNNRFLILQGEVEQISLMKPKAKAQYEVGMLEYLEDIIGSNKFVELIEDAATTVKGHEENRMLMLKKATAMEKARDDLEEAKAEAEEFLSKERQLIKKSAIQAQILEAEAQAVVSKTTEQLKEISAKRTEQVNQLKEKEKEVKIKKKEYEKVSSEHKCISEQVQQHRKAWAAFERKDIKYRENIKHAQKNMKKAANREKSNLRRHKDNLEKHAELEVSLPGLDATVETLRDRKEKEELQLEKIEESLKEETKSLSAKMAAKQEEQKPWRNKADTANSARETANTEMQLLLDNTRNAQEQAARLQEEIEELQGKEGVLRSELDAANHEALQAGKQILAAEKEQEDVGAAAKKLLEQTRTHRAAVESVRMAQRQVSSQGKVLKSLIAAARPGGPLSKAGLKGE